jgi:hypothetical protein
MVSWCACKTTWCLSIFLESGILELVPEGRRDYSFTRLELPGDVIVEPASDIRARRYTGLWAVRIIIWFTLASLNRSCALAEGDIMI